MVALIYDRFAEAAWRTRAVRLWRRYPQAVTAGALALAAVAVVAGIVAYQHYSERAAATALLRALWADYKRTSWEAASGRTVDRQNGGVTTSEGQAYTLLRAVWSDDRAIFNTTWQWTEAHMRRSDGLFSWRWGALPDGSEGILTAEGGQNTASDADADIAFALLMAHGRWHDERYLNAAKTLIPAIWDTEVVTVRGRSYLSADNIEKTSDTPTFVMNPSYLAPYEYRAFARIDPAHPWTQLAADSYTFLRDVSQAPLDTGKSAGLPPDWALVNKTTGAVTPPTEPGQTTQFGFNAFRTFWRLGLDRQLQGATDSKPILQGAVFLTDEWQHHGKLWATYRHDGQPAADYESLALYGGVLGYFSNRNSADADAIIRQKLLPLYDGTANTLTKPLTYYDNNWLWFGLALTFNQLPDLAGGGS